MLVSGIQNAKQLSELAVDVVYVGLKGLSWRCAGYFSLEELPSLQKKALESAKELWVLFNRMYEESDLNAVKKGLKLCKKLGIKGIVYSSLVVYELALSLDYQAALVYQSDTLITNRHDATFFAERNRAVVLAKEITLNDVKKITKDGPDKYAIVVHGHLNLSYSKRRFLSYYLKEYRIKSSAEKYFIQEETRDLKMPLLQEPGGTSIYSAWILESLAELVTLQARCRYLLIDPLFLSSVNLSQTVACYRGVLDGKLSAKEAGKHLPQIAEHPYHSGFHYRKTTKNKVRDDE